MFFESVGDDTGARRSEFSTFTAIVPLPLVRSDDIIVIVMRNCCPVNHCIENRSMDLLTLGAARVIAFFVTSPATTSERISVVF